MHNVVKFMVSSSASGLEFKSEILTPLEDFNSDEAALNVYTRVIQDTVEAVGAELKPLLAMLQARAEHNTNEPIEASFVITLTEDDNTITYELSTVKETDEATPAAFIAALIKQIYKFVSEVVQEDNEDSESFAALAIAVGNKNVRDILQALKYEDHVVEATVRLNSDVSAHVAKTKGTTTPSFMMESTGTMNA